MGSDKLYSPAAQCPQCCEIALGTVVGGPATGGGAQSTATVAEALKYLGAPPSAAGAPQVRVHPPLWPRAPNSFLAILPHQAPETTLLLPLWQTDRLGNSNAKATPRMAA